ncbi:MAG TPA: DUF3783 domain-containing protein [Smithellaceae bacterium]|nr:DUF3783 domain-containing protein [Smithellaceae bacterium]HRS89469.1 DUF3783 domain-containing protein [Smithellaceae bacterium]HRV26418.1 DUF3783 domain-containing protein [Smithellaceae bacterium]
MSQGTFKEIGDSAKPMYGPRAVLVCGFTPFEQETVMNLLDNIALADVPVIIAATADAEIRLGDLLARPDQEGLGAESDMARAIVMSGVTADELHRIMSAYRSSGLPRPLWATLTPVSENWALAALLEELNKERIAMEKSNK